MTSDSNRPVTTITLKAAQHAASLLEGIVAHPSWQGIDRQSLQTVIDALNGSERIEVRPDDYLPSWGIPGDEMIFTNVGGWANERELAAELFKEGQRYTITHTKIGRSSATYHFFGLPSAWNTAMFRYADEDKIAQHWRDHRDDRQAVLDASNTYVDFRKRG